MALQEAVVGPTLPEGTEGTDHNVHNTHVLYCKLIDIPLAQHSEELGSAYHQRKHPSVVWVILNLTLTYIK